MFLADMDGALSKQAWGCPDWVHYRLDVGQQLGHEVLRHSVRGSQGGDDGGGIEREDHSQLRETLRVSRKGLRKKHKRMRQNTDSSELPLLKLFLC